MIKEAKRLQQLAGIKEIEINIPGLKLFDAKIESIYSSGAGIKTEYIIKSTKNTDMPIFYGTQIGDYSRQLNNYNDLSIWMYDPEPDRENVDSDVYKLFKHLYLQLIAYLDKYTVKYEIKNNRQIVLSAKYFNITNPNNVVLKDEEWEDD